MDGWNTIFLLGRPIFKGLCLFQGGYIIAIEWGDNREVRSLRGDKQAQVNGSNSTTNVSLIGSLFIGGFVMGFEDLNRLQDLSQTGKSCKACLKDFKSFSAENSTSWSTLR